MKIRLFDLSGITTFTDVRAAYHWCNDRMGIPKETTWEYSRDIGFLGSDRVSCIEEIEYITFQNEEDAVAFKLAFI